MKYLIILTLFSGLLFGVTPVPRNSGNTDEPKNEKIVEKEKTVKKETKQKEKDHHIDKNSNGVNDQREDDFEKIKKLNSKYKDIIDKDNQKTSKTVTPTKKKTSKKSSSK